REVAYGTTPTAQFQHDPDDPMRTLHRVVTNDQVNAEAQMIWDDFSA
ncbi:MAG: acyl-ACP thioesterase, partial [Lacticaseibacillus paracasei]|nr:acyl-ACP thioesterase [Lacticaseibacillus paracasei]